MNRGLLLPSWTLWALAVGFALFVGLCVLAIRKNHGMKRSFFASPYTVWMVVFTLIPCLLIGYYALTDAQGRFTLDNFANFWDSNHIVNRMYSEMGPEYSVLIQRGTVNIDILVYSTWMALLCTVICLILGYPAAYFMTDRQMKRGSTIVVLFIIPMWMNFLLRTVAWMTLLEDQGLISRSSRPWASPAAFDIQRRGGAAGHGVQLPALHGVSHLHLPEQDGPEAAGGGPGFGGQPRPDLLQGDVSPEPARGDLRHHHGVHALRDHLLYPPDFGGRQYHDVRGFD